MISLTTPVVLVAALAVVATAGVWIRLERGHFAAVLIFTAYLVGVANFVILPLEYDPELARAVGPIPIDRLIELTPFFLPGGEPMSRDQLILNVVLTVPFGFGLPFVLSLTFFQVVVIGVLFSLGIELAQLVADALYLALPTWSVDINDVFLNSLGVVVGFAAFRVVGEVYSMTLGRMGIRSGAWAHFHDKLVEGSAEP